MTELTFTERVSKLLLSSEQKRQERIADALPALEDDMRRFLATRAGDPMLPQFLARMIRETAVAAYAYGCAHGAGTPKKPPKDSVAFYGALTTIRTMDNLYPTWRAFDGGEEAEATDG
jgi:hypothetical protein